MALADVIIDLSHHNGNVDLSKAQQSGIAGVIHKATQGLLYLDPMYQVNRAQANANGLLWGAYHFGTGDDGTKQADYFLQKAQPDQKTVLVLDFEGNPHGTSMTIQNARDFVTRVQNQTGRWPGIYGGYYLKQLIGSLPDETLKNCWFWLSQYSATPQLPANWNAWTLWQHTDGAAGPNPMPVPGVGFCDRNYYCDTPELLKTKWLTGSL